MRRLLDLDNPFVLGFVGLLIGFAIVWLAMI
jgi:hypothetical protein